MGVINVNKPSTVGKMHVMYVGQALKMYLKGQSIQHFTEPVQETVKFIMELYPNIQHVIVKYETKQPDLHPDLVVTLQHNEELNINLFYIKGSAKIQPKNLGVKSFLEKYFQSKTLQMKFNDFFENAYKTYLKNIVKTKEQVDDTDTTKQLKGKVRQYYPKFVEEIDLIRKGFLFSLREYCFSLFKEEYNDRKSGIENAFKEFFMSDSTNIITRHNGKNKCLQVGLWNLNTKSTSEIQLYKKGLTTIGIRVGTEAITIRFKFESAPVSSLKLATSYDRFPEDNQIVEENLKSINNFEQLIEKHEKTERGNVSDAIGKCNEAMTYYRLLKFNPIVNQVDSKEFVDVLMKYSSLITHETLLNIYTSSESAVTTIQHYLQEKYGAFKMESIQLIPQSYLKNRLDTRDLLLILRVDGKYVEEGFSLKGIAKNNVKITVKNPGAGQLLGPSYFDCGSLVELIEQTKKEFLQNEINHMQSLERISYAIGESLKEAPQGKLQKGITSILGNAPTVVTLYTMNKSKLIMHGEVHGQIMVYPTTPTAIQTTLSWSNHEETLTLRVKFSASQSKGWSSLKLACEYLVEV